MFVQHNLIHAKRLWINTTTANQENQEISKENTRKARAQRYQHESETSSPMTSSELIAQEPSLEGRSARGAAERKRGKQ